MSSSTSVSTFPIKQVLDCPNHPHDYPKAQTMAARRFRMRVFVLSIFFLLIVASIILTLSLTIFKPKDPDVSVHPVGLENFDLFQPNVTVVPLGLVLTIGNRNYGSFKYINSTGYISYHDTIVAEVPLVTNLVPARSRVNVTATAGVMTQKLVSEPNFFREIGAGHFNLTSKTTLPGKVIMLKILKVKATVYIACDISMKIEESTLHAYSSCISKIKF